MPVGLPILSGAGTLVISGTADRAAEYNSDGELQASDVTSTELGYLSGVTSAIQDQIDAIDTLADGTIYMGDATNTAQEVTVSGDITIDNTGVAAIAAGVIVDADVDASAAIARSKLASGSPDVVLINSGTGAMGESSVDSTEIRYVENAVPMAQITLADNQVTPSTFYSFTPFTYSILEFGINRGGGNNETGTMLITTDNTSVDISIDSVEIGDTGVTLSAVMNGANVDLQYTTTSTGQIATIQRLHKKWG